jgi:hypothetical protein
MRIGSSNRARNKIPMSAMEKSRVFEAVKRANDEIKDKYHADVFLVYVNGIVYFEFVAL